MTADPGRLRLVSREGCHLCDVMEETLAAILPLYGLGYEIVKVDDDPALLRAYGDCVPVLLAGERELARIRLSRARLVSILDGLDGPVSSRSPAPTPEPEP